MYGQYGNTYNAHAGIAARLAAERNLVAGKTRYEAYNHINTKKLELLETLCALNCLHNLLAPIQRLPEELLVPIFHEVIEDAAYCQRQGWHNVIFTLGTVCKHWRNICMATPQLWAYIDIYDSRGMHRHIHRSKNVPLKVYSNARTWFSESVYSNAQALGKHMHRVTTMALHLHRSTLSVLPGLWDAPAPELERLSLVQTSTGTAMLVHPTPWNFMNDQPFASITPKLRTLHLDRVSFPLSSTIFAGLRHLSLQHQHAAAINNSPHALLTMLSSSAQLESLTLVNAIPTINTNPSQLGHVGTIQLLNLRTLSLNKNSESETFWLLDHLHFPPTCTFDLSCGVHSSDNGLDNLIPPESAAATVFTTARKLEFRAETFDSISIEGFADRQPGNTTPPIVRIYVYLDDGMLKPRHFLPSLGSLFKTPQAEVFSCVNCAPHIGAEMWCGMLSMLPALRHISASETLDKVQYRQLIDALATRNISQGADRSGPDIICPQLTNLHLSSIDINPRVLHTLESLCKARAVGGVPLQQLSLSGPPPSFRLSGASFQALEDLVPELLHAWR